MHLFLRRSAPLMTACAVLFSLIAPLAGAAQEDAMPEGTATDGVGVARISLLEGSVALQRGDSSDSLTAAVNAPVLGGDYVTSGDAARAEIQLDGYSQLRLGPDVQMRFTHLDTNNRTIQLAAGTLDLRLLKGVDGTNAIDTPSITVKPEQGGSYRVSVTPDGQTLVTVRSGDAQIDTPQGTQELQPGRTLIAQGEASNPTIQTEAAVALDDFDRFNADRDRASAPALAANSYVNPAIGGVEDLDDHGRWVSDGSYGHVWVPADVGPDWAPYRNGRWVWEEGYGWTWIASEPWGWAPYHYGSWYNSPNYGWCWYPPQPHVFVPWRPALVAFIGFGGGGGFSLSFGGGNAFGQIGWVPLAPFEAYHPWWGNRYGSGRPAVVNNITNITNVTNVTNVNVYKNVQYNAVSSVSSQRFLQGNFTHNVAVTAPQLREARVFRGALPVVPTASNLRFASSTTPPTVAVRPALMERSFAGNHVAVTRTPFSTQRVALATATHAAVTPLHFKDAQTTPLMPARNVEHAVMPAEHALTPGERNGTAVERAGTPAERTLTPVEKAASQEPRPGINATAPHPVSGAAAAGAWTRFHQTRPEPNTAERSITPAQTNHLTPAETNHTTPAETNHTTPVMNRTTPISGAERTTTAATERIPSYAKRTPASGSYAEPRTTQNGTQTLNASGNTRYHAPANDSESRAPATYYHAPVRPNADRAPISGQTVGHRAGNGGTAAARTQSSSHQSAQTRAEKSPPKSDPHENHQPPRRGLR